MDGILVLVLIGWLIKFASSQKKKKAGKASAAAKWPGSFPKESPFSAAKEDAPVYSEPVRNTVPAEGMGYTQEWAGSLEMDSTEGEDLCDPSLGHEKKMTDPQSVYAGEIGREPLLDTSPRGLLQGVIMSEILTRPTQRKYR